MSEKLRFAPAPTPSSVISGNARFTALTPSLIRMEHAEDGQFRDAATQVVINRDFPTPEFSVTDLDEGVEIRTSELRLTYTGGPFAPGTLSVAMRTAAQGSHETTWHYGDKPMSDSPWPKNLGGTARTLDEADGAVPLEPGLISSIGYSVLDDSDSLAMTEDGWVAAKDFEGEDLYFFGYGKDHKAALRAFFDLTGNSPLLPRKALGNWWSRYHRYSADEYIALMDSFAARDIPFSVAVIDMDWHLVDIDKDLGTGWTGYTWNRELFPDPEEFLVNLRSRGMLTSLNVHPADGVRRHEDAYENMATAMGVDPETGEEIPFDIADKKFAEAYFKYLHHPHEESGVDFWWVDWQSGANSSLPGLDPLWMLNYLHYEDNAKEGRRPLTFSRYAGPGSHRYPVGFSGDTVITWDSLAFQPYFTATAANIGYYWWSHDIGGHMLGAKDNELATRWVQFGVFSPIMRLHSSNSRFTSKDPKHFGPVAAGIQAEFLRLRHKLVPYLYTAMWEANSTGEAPVRPMYHDHPLEHEAYFTPDQYMFGPNLLVAPIIEPADPETGLGYASVWLPDGEWIDIFTGTRYTGGRQLRMHRPLETIPVLARAGAVIPLATQSTQPIADAPETLEFSVWSGPDASGKLVEDNGALHPEVTTITWDSTWEDDSLTLQLSGDFAPSGLPKRDVTLFLNGCQSGTEVLVNGVPVAVNAAPEKLGLRVPLGELDLAAAVSIRVEGLTAQEGRQAEEVFRLLDEGEFGHLEKEQAWAAYEGALSNGNPSLAIGAWVALDMPATLRNALIELLTASSA